VLHAARQRAHLDVLHRADLAAFDNELAEGRFIVDDKPVALTDIRAPIFAVGTERDHIAPWRSTYKIHLQTDTEVTYLLTTGGHNAGIVSEPSHPGRSFQIVTKQPEDHYLDPDAYLTGVQRRKGSWWPEWTAWLEARSGEPVSPDPAEEAMRKSICNAPGTYVLQD